MNSFPSRVSFARLPTPIEPLLHLSNEWKVDLRVKRDDLTGTDLTGNKIRKLEYLLADAVARGCNHIVTCGAVASNHTRATAIAARKLGLGSTLLLAGEPPETAIGNLQLELLAGAEVRYVSWSEYSNELEKCFQQTEADLRRQGKKPYSIPVGGSCPLGVFGYAKAMEEIAEQCRDLLWKPDFVVCAVGSGGTYAGLLYGNALFSVCNRVIGVLVCNTIEYFTRKVLEDIAGAVQIAGDENRVTAQDVFLVEGDLAGGYGRTNAEQIRFIGMAAQTEGLILDPVYTGKALYGLHLAIRMGKIPAGSRILFVHTGGIFGLAGFAVPFTREFQSVEQWFCRNQ